MPPKKQKVLELDDEPRVKLEPGVEQQQQQQQQAAREAQGVVVGDSVVEALVVSNSRLCAQVAACEARAFTEFERARANEEWDDNLQHAETRLVFRLFGFAL